MDDPAAEPAGRPPTPADDALAVSSVRLPARPTRWRLLLRVVLLVVSAITLYGLAPSLLAVFAEAPRLRDVDPVWFVAMILAQVASFACVWWLTRIAIPGTSWFVAATSQLVSNAITRAVPGGPALGAAVGWRMLAAAGIDRGRAGAAIAATSFISNGVLFAIPLVAVLGSIFGAPVPANLAVVAWGGALVFVLLFAFGFVIVRFDRPLHAFGRFVERLARSVYAKLKRPDPPTADSIVHQRNRVVDALGSRWEQALAATVGKWLLDYIALICALYAVGADPRLSVVLLAYGSAAVLSMIPLTPGGLGFVEAGLTAMLLLAGVTGSQALLATLAYRIASYWLPLPAGLVAWILFRRRYGPEAIAPAAGQPA